MKPFLKQPKSVEEFAKDISDFAITRALIKLLIDRMHFWYKNRAVNDFRNNLNLSINRMKGIEQVLDFYINTTIEDGEGRVYFNESQDIMYNSMLDWFDRHNKKAVKQLKTAIKNTELTPS
jgi:hypothetical protein